MVPAEIFEMINTNINLYKTCKSFYDYKTIYYKYLLVQYHLNIDVVNYIFKLL